MALRLKIRACFSGVDSTRCLRYLGLSALFMAPLFAQTPAETEFFEKKIRPVLAEKCYGCHSSKLKSPMGGLVLDTKSGLEEGRQRRPRHRRRATRHPAGCSKALTYNQTELRMPPTGKLPDEKIAAFEKWIAAGAPDPREDTPEPAAAARRRQARHGYRNRPQMVGLPAGGAAAAAESQGRRIRQALD